MSASHAYYPLKTNNSMFRIKFKKFANTIPYPTILCSTSKTPITSHNKTSQTYSVRS